MHVVYFAGEGTQFDGTDDGTSACEDAEGQAARDCDFLFALHVQTHDDGPGEDGEDEVHGS